MNASEQPAKTLLIVEDNSGAREVLASICRGHGYDAITVADGGAALELLRRGTSVDLVVLDMLLPRVDGWRFLDLFRTERTRSIPVMIVTGTNLTKEWADTHGCAGFIKKPFDEAALLAEVRRCLGQN
jgi:CheY-like chemotaxis protein